ncbi:PREDICTED: uncharacterized protein LOC103075286 [Lipotes vexillifer]|uniref:Uncharacterized protein LOC103075286 n=1 Tax=Lipotes vexillifer TaxID=118797 RepID=A0A340XCL3_LIPVE|nr:PREDICTED: uncharacterized protein LOC103075286 [Lipotes vexillifer]
MGLVVWTDGLGALGPHITPATSFHPPEHLYCHPRISDSSLRQAPAKLLLVEGLAPALQPLQLCWHHCYERLKSGTMAWLGQLGPGDSCMESGQWPMLQGWALTTALLIRPKWLKTWASVSNDCAQASGARRCQGQICAGRGDGERVQHPGQRRGRWPLRRCPRSALPRGAPLRSAAPCAVHWNPALAAALSAAPDLPADSGSSDSAGAPAAPPRVLPLAPGLSHAAAGCLANRYSATGRGEAVLLALVLAVSPVSSAPLLL